VIVNQDFESRGTPTDCEATICKHKDHLYLEGVLFGLLHLNVGSTQLIVAVDLSIIATC